MHPYHSTERNPRIIDITGQRFGRLTVIEIVPAPSHKRKKEIHWRCICDCGNEAVVNGYQLRCGKTQSCGCLQSERAHEAKTTHGMSKSPEWHTWVNMIARCSPTSTDPRYYAGRGITVCERWRESFENFYADLGPRPSPKHSIDRINNDLGYSPDNCRWTTETIQQNNKRSNHRMTLNGETHTLTEWARILDIPWYRIANRLKHNLPIEQVLSKDHVLKGEGVTHPERKLRARNT